MAGVMECWSIGLLADWILNSLNPPGSFHETMDRAYSAYIFKGPHNLSEGAGLMQYASFWIGGIASLSSLKKTGRIP
jgi:hypothetical protein